MSKLKNDKIVLEGGYVRTKIENIHEHLQEVGRGAGIQKAKKGKGSYNRKEKHRYNKDDYKRC